MESNAIKLNEIVAPAFYNVFWDILDGKHTYYDLYGGRGSTKSSFVGGMIPFQMMQDAENGLMSNAVIFRKVGNTLRESVYEQIAWGIDALGASDLWADSLSPMQYVYKPTGQKIIFRGLDKAKKTKSIKVKKDISSTFGLRSLMSLPELKKSVQFNSLYFVVEANLKYLRHLIHRSAGATGRTCMWRNRELTATDTRAIIDQFLLNGLVSNLLMMQSI